MSEDICRREFKVADFTTAAKDIVPNTQTYRANLTYMVKKGILKTTGRGIYRCAHPNGRCPCGEHRAPSTLAFSIQLA